MASAPYPETAASDPSAETLLRLARLFFQVPADRHADAAETAPAFGRYAGLPPQIILLADGRNARLLAPIAYHQQDGTPWEVPAGSYLDGASIPRILWSLIGGPFEGRYRDASIVHDFYCVTRSRSWRATHRMFYEAMRCSGVGVAQAKILYYSVYRFGPRWSEDAEAAAVSTPSGRQPGAAEQVSLAADAEAIAVHDLDVAEIEALADLRLRADHAATESTPSGPLERARLLVVPGGSGTAEDADAVVREAMMLPPFVLDLFERRTIRIIACRGGVTDFERNLRGVTPRGWEGTGRTWDNVPGTYFDDRRRVVIATIAAGAGRAVPTAASGLHGSASLVVHESLHGYDYAQQHAVLRDRTFVAAREADLPRLGSYERQPGPPGLEETYAESGARFIAARHAMAADWSNLCAFWQTGLARGTETAALPASEAASTELGTATLEPGETIRLDLRAEGPGGAIGHAAFAVPVDDAAYLALRAHLFGATESAGTMPRAVPFTPLATGSAGR